MINITKCRTKQKLLSDNVRLKQNGIMPLYVYYFLHILIVLQVSLLGSFLVLSNKTKDLSPPNCTLD